MRVAFEFLDGRGQIELDHVSHIVDVDTSRDGIGGYQYIHFLVLKSLEGQLALSLRAVSVDLGTPHRVLCQLSGDPIGDVLFICKDDSRFLLATVSFLFSENLDQDIYFVFFGTLAFDLDDALFDRFVGGTHFSDGHACKIGSQIRLFGDGPQGFRKGRREQECLSIRSLGHVALFDDLAQLRFESHIQHPIGFVQHQELAFL
mmetsp:Transcript_10360/g.11823  ORF Transcript_10360/g.11823 Transcript_10360/m.11823 type:complete len:203 (-) Transcript_10360:1033-1641(-)